MWILTGNVRFCLLVFCLAVSLGLAADDQARLQLCVGDGSPWPPYTYWQEGAEGPQAESLTGYATQLVVGALDNNKIAYDLVFLPWARVQHELSHQSGRCQATWDASYTSDRAEFSLFSKPLYHITLGYLYVERDLPTVELTDLSVICGVQGYNYDQFAGHPKPTFTADTLQQALRMLEAGRCDFLASEVEPVLGGLHSGIYDISENLNYQSTGLTKSFHVQVSRFTPEAEQLVALFDDFLAELEQTSRLDDLRARYFMDTTAR